MNRAIQEIQRYGLARIDYRDQTIQLHRLVKTVLVSRLSEQQWTEMEHGAHVLLAGGNPGNPPVRRNGRGTTRSFPMSSPRTRSVAPTPRLASWFSM